jgi:hypothetical protein
MPVGNPDMKMDLEKCICERVDLIQLAQDRDQCWAVLNVVMYL